MSKSTISTLLELWAEYITTKRYIDVRTAANAASFGLNFIAASTDVFTDFMEWLEGEPHE